ncbi:hypothetical protein GIX45_27790 [Erwinia sp. CPCC 100877]|nr:hypothetical protein [Erwinia sp. CPCC 100877]
MRKTNLKNAGLCCFIRNHLSKAVWSAGSLCKKRLFFQENKAETLVFWE